MDAIQTLKTAVVRKDAVLANRAVNALRPKGYTYQDCYRIGLAADPGLTLDAWEDLMIEADALDGQG